MNDVQTIELHPGRDVVAGELGKAESNHMEERDTAITQSSPLHSLYRDPADVRIILSMAATGTLLSLLLLASAVCTDTSPKLATRHPGQSDSTCRNNIRVTVISPGVTESEFADSITDHGAREAMREFRRIAIPPEAIARAIAFAVEQSDDVDVNEIIVSPTASLY
jgi:hypothetical protein